MRMEIFKVLCGKQLGFVSRLLLFKRGFLDFCNFGYDWYAWSVFSDVMGLNHVIMISFCKISIKERRILLLKEVMAIMIHEWHSDCLDSKTYKPTPANFLRYIMSTSANILSTNNALFLIKSKSSMTCSTVPFDHVDDNDDDERKFPLRHDNWIF